MCVVRCCSRRSTKTFLTRNHRLHYVGGDILALSQNRECVTVQSAIDLIVVSSAADQRAAQQKQQLRQRMLKTTSKLQKTGALIRPGVRYGTRDGNLLHDTTKDMHEAHGRHDPYTVPRLSRFCVGEGWDNRGWTPLPGVFHELSRMAHGIQKPHRRDTVTTGTASNRWGMKASSVAHERVPKQRKVTPSFFRTNRS